MYSWHAIMRSHFYNKQMSFLEGDYTHWMNATYTMTPTSLKCYISGTKIEFFPSNSRQAIATVVQGKWFLIKGVCNNGSSGSPHLRCRSPVFRDNVIVFCLLFNVAFILKVCSSILCMFNQISHFAIWEARLYEKFHLTDTREWMPLLVIWHGRKQCTTHSPIFFYSRNYFSPFQKLFGATQKTGQYGPATTRNQSCTKWLLSCVLGPLLFWLHSAYILHAHLCGITQNEESVYHRHHLSSWVIIVI